MKLKINQLVEMPSGKIGIIESIGVNTVWVAFDDELKYFRPEELTAPKTVKSFDGKDISIKAMQQSLTTYPLNLRAVISDNGEPALIGATYKTYKCGCDIIGNGTLQFPLSIKFCSKHQ